MEMIILKKTQNNLLLKSYHDREKLLDTNI